MERIVGNISQKSLLQAAGLSLGRLCTSNYRAISYFGDEPPAHGRSCWETQPPLRGDETLWNSEQSDWDALGEGSVPCTGINHR